MSSTGYDMEQIVRDHHASVYRFCARRVGADLAADAAQDTFVTAQRALRSFRGESSLGTWLFGIANNECRRAVRKRRVEIGPLQIDVPNPNDVTESIIVDREALFQAMDKLSDEQREVVLLHELEGLTYEEAAQVLGIPVGTVKSRIHHAFRHLRCAIFGLDTAPGEAVG